MTQQAFAPQPIEFINPVSNRANRINSVPPKTDIDATPVVVAGR